MTNRAADDEGGDGTEIGQVKGNLHARVATADDEHLLGVEVDTIAVGAGVEELAAEILDALEHRHHRLGVLAGRHHEPAGAEFCVHAGRGAAIGAGGGGGRGRGVDVPQAGAGVELRPVHRVVELGLQPEVARVRLEVVHELVPRRVRREVLREREPR